MLYYGYPGSTGKIGSPFRQGTATGLYPPWARLPVRSSPALRVKLVYGNL